MRNSVSAISETGENVLAYSNKYEISLTVRNIDAALANVSQSDMQGVCKSLQPDIDKEQFLKIIQMVSAFKK